LAAKSARRPGSSNVERLRNSLIASDWIGLSWISSLSVLTIAIA
jgi:hypothetical protein